MPTHIVVLGERMLSERVSRSLSASGFDVANNSAEARFEAQAVVMCCAGPGKSVSHGRTPQKPTIVVGHRESPCASCGLALELFADAWIPEQLLHIQLPLTLRGLVRRIHARRRASLQLTFESKRSAVWIGARSVALRPTEFELMAYLATKAGSWASQEAILKDVFGARFSYDTALVRVHIHALRKALGDFASCIESRRGLGYRISNALLEREG